MNQFRKSIENLCNKPYAFPLTLLIIFIPFFSISFFGLDVIDTSFLLFSYFNVFTNPTGCEFSFIYYFSVILGGFFHIINPSGGIFYYKMISILFYFMSLSITWILLKNHINRFYIIIGILLASSFKIPAINISHNAMSVFIALLSLWAIYSGLKKKNIFLLLIGGVLIGINAFTRLTNITMIVLLLLIPANAYLNMVPRKRWIIQFVITLFGILLGCTAIFALMRILGHWDIFLNSIDTLSSLAGSEESSHNITALILNYIGIYLRIILFFVIIFCSWVYFDKILPKVKNISVKYTLGIGYCLLFPIITLALLQRSWGIITPLYYMLIFLTSGYLLYQRNINSYLKLIIIGNILIQIFLPIGSDGYILLSRDTLTNLSVPLILYFADIVNKERFIMVKQKYNIKLRGKILSYIVWGVIIITAFHNIIYATKTSGEVSWIWERSHKIDSPLCKNIYTTREWSERVNSITSILHRYVKPGDYMFVYTHPIVGYLTDTKPYLPCSCPMLFYPSVSYLNLKIRDAENIIKEKPIVIIDNFGVENSEKESFIKKNKNWSAMKDFLVRHKYGVTWKNQYYIILHPESNTPAQFSDTINYPLIIN
ncbi:MAG: hypothetical protein RR341_06095 [Bacteroidales bacterium]